MVIITSFQYPESPIKLQETNVRAILDKKELGTGTLYVSESTLTWQESGDKGFCIPYTKVSLHAISKDANVHPTDCIYIVIDAHITLPNCGAELARPVESEGEDEFSDAESEPEMSELIFVPENLAVIPVMYEAIKVCQELNPDPIDMDDDDDEEDNMFADAEDMLEEEDGGGDHQLNGDSGIEEISERLQNQRVHLNNVALNDDEGFDQFEDAD